MTTPQANWYPDAQDPTLVRWWDGQQWTEHTRPMVDPASGAPDDAPSPPVATKRPLYRRTWVLVTGGILALVLIVSVLSKPQADAVAESSPTATAEQTTEAATAAEAEEAAAKEVRKAEEAAAEEARKAEEQRLAEESAAAEAARIGTLSQQNAHRSAVSYLDYSAFSRSGLIKQLEFEGFPAEDAEFAVARLEAEGGVDWNAQAAASAANYLQYTSFSRSGLIDQLIFEGFSPEQAEHGVSTTGL